MPTLRSLSPSLVFALLVGGAAPSYAESPADFIAAYERAARQDASGSNGFSPERGRQFFNTTHGGEWSCASCHTSNPAAAGKHAKTGKNIAPLAPGANSERFTRAAKVEKWFKRNCNDVLSRPCTAQEKGDVLTYLMGIRP